jgi:hypothetical protein
MSDAESQSEREPLRVVVRNQGLLLQGCGAQLVVCNSDGQPLDPTSASVLVALGGREPAWLDVVTALGEVAASCPGDDAALLAASAALDQSDETRASTAPTTTDRATLVALASAGCPSVGQNPALV